jgi:hypothetical protein
MALPCEQAFQDALDAVERHEEEIHELQTEVIEGMRGFSAMGERMLESARIQFQRRLRRLGMAMHPRWRRLIHKGCIFKAPCGCLISRGVKGCSEHKEVVRHPPQKKKELPKEQKVVEPPKEPVIPATTVIMRKATWLLPRSETVSITLPETSNKPKYNVNTKPKIERKPDQRLVEAAAGSLRIDQMMNPTKAEDAVPGPIPTAESQTILK